MGDYSEAFVGLDTSKLRNAVAIADAGLKRAEIDGILCGYSTVSRHIMLATVFAEHFGIRPSYAHAVQVGGATGLAMTMLAHHLVDAGVAKHVLVVGGENRLTGQSRDASIVALAQVGHPDYEVTLGPTIPAYYGLVASRYMHEYGVTEQDLAELAVLMRRNALTHPGAQFHEPISVADVMASKPVASPFRVRATRKHSAEHEPADDDHPQDRRRALHDPERLVLRLVAHPEEHEPGAQDAADEAQDPQRAFADPAAAARGGELVVGVGDGGHHVDREQPPQQRRRHQRAYSAPRADGGDGHERAFAD